MRREARRPTVAVDGSTTSIAADGGGPPDPSLALLASLADGETRDVAELARSTPGFADGTRLAAALDALADAGLAIVRHDARVRLATPFAPLDPAALASLLPDWRVDVRAIVDSTNATALQWTAHASGVGVDGPALFATEMQRAGRGRLGRTWSSLPGASLTASFAIAVGRRLSALDGVTLVCGLAVRDAIAAHGVDVALKWPNDLLVAGRKVGGILVEAQGRGDGAMLVVGVGLNVSGVRDDAHASGLAPAHLAASGGRDLDRHRLAAGIARALHERLAAFARDGFGPFVDEWNAADAFRGRRIVLRSGLPADARDVREGVARGVDATGALVVDGASGRRRVVVGDVSLRPA